MSPCNVWIKHVVLMCSFTALLSGCFRPDVIIPPGPPEEGFVLGPEDVIEVVVWKNPDLSREVVIRPDGRISLPLIGDVSANNITADQLASDIAESFKAYKENPSVSVNVLEVNSYYVFVVGEVNVPGKLALKSYTTILQALSLAGGFTQFASSNDILVVRNMTNAAGKGVARRRPGLIPCPKTNAKRHENRRPSLPICERRCKNRRSRSSNSGRSRPCNIQAGRCSSSALSLPVSVRSGCWLRTYRGWEDYPATSLWKERTSGSTFLSSPVSS